jgi:hypothetical protein
MACYAVPQGRIVKGWTVRLVPSPELIVQFRRDDGARRFACNWTVGQIRQAFTAGSVSNQFDSDVWSHSALRKRWNHVKADVAPWWGGVFEGLLQRDSGRCDRAEELARIEDRCARRPQDGVPAIP